MDLYGEHTKLSKEDIKKSKELLSDVIDLIQIGKSLKDARDIKIDDDAMHAIGGEVSTKLAKIKQVFGVNFSGNTSAIDKLISSSVESATTRAYADNVAIVSVDLFKFVFEHLKANESN